MIAPMDSDPSASLSRIKGRRRAILTVWAWRVMESLLLIGAGVLFTLRIAARGSVWVGLGGLVCLICWGVAVRLEPFTLLVRESEYKGWELHQ